MKKIEVLIIIIIYNISNKLKAEKCLEDKLQLIFDY